MTRKVSIPINFGRQDKTSPKHAPFGVLKSCKNLRHREQGGLGLRRAYEALGMTTPSGTLVAYDLHEINGRLIALGSDRGDGYPTELFEYVGLDVFKWRPLNTSGLALLSPFTNLRGLAGIPHPDGGVTTIDAAAGGGYVCVLFKPGSSTLYNVMIVRQEDDQTILMSAQVGQYDLARVTYADGAFFIIGNQTITNTVTVRRFRPGTDQSFLSFYTVDTGSATAATALDIVPVANVSTAILVAAFDRGAAIDLEVHAIDNAGAQVGTTCLVATTNTSFVSLEADQTANQINLLTVEAANAVRLRTFDFSGTLLTGPTAMTSGPSAQICRLSSTRLAVAVNTAVGSIEAVEIKRVTISSHALADTITIQAAQMQTRLVPGVSANQAYAFVFGAIISPETDNVDASNALFFVTNEVAHMCQRDYLNALPVTHGAGLMLDSSTGRLVWTAATDDGSGVAMPSIAVVDFKSTARRQSAKFGGLLYFAGAPPIVYDNRMMVEPGFELPGIISVTASNGAGALTPGATYSYQVHFEITLADGSLIEGPPSDITNVTMGGSDDTNTLVVQTPHCLAVAVGNSLYGASATAVVSRTEWSPNTVSLTTGLPGAQLSVFRRAKTLAVPVGMSNYGGPLTITDTISDADLADEAPIYTQAERGALSGTLEHDLPQSCSYISASESRMHTGGLTRSHEIQVSKAAFLGSCFNWSEFSPFFATVGARVRGVQSLDQVRFVFVEDDIFALDGAAPDDLGKGAVNDPIQVPTPGGLKDWRSLLKEQGGLWGQWDDDKIFRIPRGGGSPEWMGVDIVKLLKDFPTITAASRHIQDNCALFALNNTGLTSARVAVRDLHHGTWLVDEPPLSSNRGIEALVVYGRTCAYISGGVVYAQSATSYTESADFIDNQLVTQPIYPFGLGGYGLLHDMLLTAEYRGDCTLTVRVSYDDGVTFPFTLAAFTITGLSSGAAVRKRWAMPQDVMSSAIFEITLTGTAGSEALILNQIDLLVEDVNDLAQLPPADNG